MPRFIIKHTTRYTYHEPVTDSTNQIMLYPLADAFQKVLSQYIDVTGNPQIETHTDYYGNRIGTFMLVTAHNELSISSKIEVETLEKLYPADEMPAAEQWAMLDALANHMEYIDFLIQENFPSLAAVKAVADAGYYRSVSVYVAALQLTQYVYDHFKYIQGVTNVETTVEEIWKLKAGVCQDFAHMLLVMLRILGVPARYVSGYICPKDAGMRGEGATHAWVEVFIPNYGWLGLDPTNNCIATSLHVRLAIGRNFSDCSPVRGTYRGTASQSLEVGVSVVYEDGKVSNELHAALVPQPVLPAKEESDKNSYRAYMQMMQQQQQ